MVQTIDHPICYSNLPDMIYSGSSSNIRGRCCQESPIRLNGYISCQSYLIFLRKAITALLVQETLAQKTEGISPAEVAPQ